MSGTGICDDVAHGFHDDAIHGLALEAPDPDRDDWASRLSLDIDHIVEWLRDDDGFAFRVVQALLIFEDVSDLRVSFAFPEVSLNPLPIDQVSRSVSPVVERGDYRLYDWTIGLNDGEAGRLTLRARGYRLVPVGEATVQSEQGLPKHLRRAWHRTDLSAGSRGEARDR